MRLEAAFTEANLDFDQIQRVSELAHVICIWARAMLRYVTLTLTLTLTQTQLANLTRTLALTLRYHRCALVLMPYREVLRALEQELQRLMMFAQSPCLC